MDDVSLLLTEQNNPRTRNIDVMSTDEFVTCMNAEDRNVTEAIKQEIPSISNLLDACYKSLSNGGRMFYIGAGTSGRLGILDASECPPTYGVTPDLVQGLIAGGQSAIFAAKEGAEDSKEQARLDLMEVGLTDRDIVIGIAASGRTPYVLSALEYANSIGSQTGSIACVKNSLIGELASYPVEVATGEEVIMGSTRLKAGTAQKLILNTLSTGVMVKLGKVYQNYMVDVQPTNLKLEKRAIRLIRTITEVQEEEAIALFKRSGGNVKCALVMHKYNLDKEAAQHLLEAHDGYVRKILED